MRQSQKRFHGNFPRFLLPALAAASLGAIPATAGAGDARLFKTTFVSEYHPAGVYEGTLRVTFGRDGTIFGFYRPVDGGQLKQVYGGLDGEHIHLEIDGYAPIEGTYEDGKIVGTTLLDRDIDEFTAIPASEPNS